VPVSVSIAHTQGKRQYVVTVSGELDMSLAGMLKQRLSGSLEADEVVLDLTRVTFIDSTGIGVIAAAHRRLNSGERKRLRVFGDHPPLNLVFEAAGMAELLEADRRRRPRA
jgi:anti-anti-sigma factor